MTIPEVIRNNYIPTLFGALVAFMAAKLTSKTARLRYSTVVERVALSADDAIFGAVQVTWGNGNAVRNLYLVTMEVENESSRDFAAVELKVFCGNETLMLSEQTSILDSPYIVQWSPEFATEMTVPHGGAPSQAQFEKYHHTREYKLGVFNRSQRLHLTYLCTRPNDDVTPALHLSTQLKGARLHHQPRKKFIHGIPTRFAITDGLVIAVVVTAICGRFLHHAIVASIICTVVGLFAQSLGAMEYKARKWLWRLLAG